MIWTHLPQRSDMFAVFDVIRKVGFDMVVSEIKVLKLVRGGELLVSLSSRTHLPIDLLTSTLKEQVEFPNLQDQVRMDEERALTQHISDYYLRVLVIVKRPLLALRYMLPDGQIRKTQMNFMPISGCDVALETFRAAGLPIRDKDLPQLQDQRPQSAQSQPGSQNRPGSLNAYQVQRPQSSGSQPHSQERPGLLNTGQAARVQSSQGAFVGSSQPLSQEAAGVRNSVYGSVPPYAQPIKLNTRPTSAPGEVNQDDFSKPILAPYRSTMNASGSTSTVTTVPAVAKSMIHTDLLPSPIFNGTYEPFGSDEVRPMSAPEQTQTQRDYTNSPPLSQMLPPERTLPFPEKEIHAFKRDEATAQEEAPQQKPASKARVKRQTKPRAQPAKTRKSRAKVGATIVSSDPLAPSSPSPTSREKGKDVTSSAPPKAHAKAKAPPDIALTRNPSPELQAIPPSSEPPALPSINPRKRSLTDRSVNQPNKRQEQARSETVTEKMTEAPMTAISEHSLQAQPPQATDPLINIRNHELLDTIDNFMRKYHDLATPKPPPQTAKEHLAEYAAQSDEDRARAIDNMICTCLEDENFGKLMEDVEGAWKRIGLGL